MSEPDGSTPNNPPEDPPRRPRGWRDVVADRLELPKDIVLDLPRLVILGDLQVVIENHRGIMEYTPERIIIAVNKGRLRIEGEELTIGSIQEEQITVTGSLRLVAFDA